jgi:mono/diheme cytochrome c family protein
VPPGALVLAALGSIVFGLATPTEGAACGALGALVLTAAYGRLTWRNLHSALVKTMDTIINTTDAIARPMGLAQGPDGSLYISDSRKGKIWRIMYKGDKSQFGNEDLAAMGKRKTESAHIKDPDEVADNLQKGTVAAGEQVYNIYCIACHQHDGKGDGSRFPPLDGSEWVTGDEKRLIGVLLNGLEKPIKVKGKTFNNLMPQHSFLSDDQLASVITYIRQNFGNQSSAVTPEEIAGQRKASIAETLK